MDVSRLSMWKPMMMHYIFMMAQPQADLILHGALETSEKKENERRMKQNEERMEKEKKD